MIPRPRVPRLGRSSIVLILAAAALAFPIGVLASHQFTDVPDSHDFHADIDAIADAGITTGCTATTYCPASNVTRGQMAAFLNRLGALAPGKTPVVNADKVDGITSTDLMPGGNPPGGMTIRGQFAMNGTAGITWDAFSFGYELSLTPDAHFLAAGSASTAECPGTPSNPEAALGELCIYEDASNVSGNPAFDCVFDAETDQCDTAGREGFSIAQNGDDTGWFSAGTWAVTEPLVIIIPLNEEQAGDGRSPFGEAAD